MGALHVPEEIQPTLDALDAFVAAEIAPLLEEDDNIRFFDHRREYARTDWERGGISSEDWIELLNEVRRRADAAGWYRFMLPKELGGQEGTNLQMAVIREHFASQGLVLHNDLQDERSVVGSLSDVMLLHRYGSQEQREEFVEGMITGDRFLSIALTEPGHGSDVTHLETVAERTANGWRINGSKRWNSRVDRSTHNLVFARTSGDAGNPSGITAFIVPMSAQGHKVESYWWTLNMPTDHGEVSITDVEVPEDAILGEVGQGLAVAQTFVHEQRIRQAAASLGAGQFCVDEAVKYANSRVTFGKKLSLNQGIQFPLVELHTELAMLRMLVRFTANELDHQNHMAISDYVAMCNYRANRLCCQAADQAMQTCGGVGYSRHMPFEHIYRTHRRYRITEGADEIQMRRIGQRLFGLYGRGEEDK